MCRLLRAGVRHRGRSRAHRLRRPPPRARGQRIRDVRIRAKASSSRSTATATSFRGSSGTAAATTSPRSSRLPAARFARALLSRGDPLLGYGRFDEYKVMGLAPYGDPAAYRDAARAVLRAAAATARYRIALDGIAPRTAASTSRSGAKASRSPTSHTRSRGRAAGSARADRLPCAAPAARAHGLAQRCASRAASRTTARMNGKLLSSGLFDDVFVQPAAHDAGCALGAALMTSARPRADAPRRGAGSRMCTGVRELGPTTRWSASSRAWDRVHRGRALGRRRARRGRADRRRRRDRLGAGPLGVRPARARQPQHPRRPAPRREQSAHQRDGQEARRLPARSRRRCSKKTRATSSTCRQHARTLSRS